MTCKPPLIPVNTGKPVIPKRIYTRMESEAFFAPRKLTAKNTAKVCNENGMVAGIQIQEQIVNKTVNNEM